ncbi:hypothetical protein Q5752_005754 [Cryptotrichosporon argae]
MAAEDILPAIVTIALIYAAVRYFVGKKPADSSALPGVTREMVDAVASAFPDVPARSVVYSLARTRSVQATSEEILERGFLPAPPASFSPPAALLPAAVHAAPAQSPAKPAPARPAQSLLARFGIEADDKGKRKEGAGAGAGEAPKWEATRESRETDLRRRKERMILEARRRMLEKQQAQ